MFPQHAVRVDIPNLLILGAGGAQGLDVVILQGLEADQ
jgi:hypothetical protein